MSSTALRSPTAARSAQTAPPPTGPVAAASLPTSPTAAAKKEALSAAAAAPVAGPQPPLSHDNTPAPPPPAPAAQPILGSPPVPSVVGGSADAAPESHLLFSNPVAPSPSDGSVVDTSPPPPLRAAEPTGVAAASPADMSSVGETPPQPPLPSSPQAVQRARLPQSGEAIAASPPADMPIVRDEPTQKLESDEDESGSDEANPKDLKSGNESQDMSSPVRRVSAKPSGPNAAADGSSEPLKSSVSAEERKANVRRWKEQQRVSQFLRLTDRNRDRH